MKSTLPNILTISRILAIPVFVGIFHIGGEDALWICAIIFVLAGLTDFLDGYLARRWNVQSKFGGFLDHIADKMLNASVLMMLLGNGHIAGFDVLAVLLIIEREILISGLREYLAQINISLPVNRLGKIKTATQMIAIFLLIINAQPLQYYAIEVLARIALWVATFFTCLSGYVYCIKGYESCNRSI